MIITPSPSPAAAFPNDHSVTWLHFRRRTHRSKAVSLGEASRRLMDALDCEEIIAVFAR